MSEKTLGQIAYETNESAMCNANPRLLYRHWDGWGDHYKAYWEETAKAVADAATAPLLKRIKDTLAAITERRRYLGRMCGEGPNIEMARMIGAQNCLKELLSEIRK